MVVLIPHHSRRDCLIRCLSAVQDWPVLVVDDSSNGIEPLDVETVRTRGSVGFAAAVNHGLALLESRGVDRALILNDDAIVNPSCIETLLSDWGPQDGALGPVLLDPQGRATSGIYVGRFGRVRARRGEAPGPVDAVSGAAMLLRTSERFDDGYVHGFEDIALCRGLRERALAVRVVAEAFCQHVGGATVHPRSRWAQRAALYGHLRFVGSGWRQIVVVALALAQVVRERGPLNRVVGVAQACQDAWFRSYSAEGAGASSAASSARAEEMASARPGSIRTR